MIAEGGHYIDGSWLLSVRIDALNVDRTMRVHGDWSIGRVLVKLTEDLDSPPTKKINNVQEISLSPELGHADWSDYALWWPLKHRWILQTHASLDQYGLQADAVLHFIRTHGRLKVQLPDLQIRQFCDVNFTEPAFRVVILLCKYLGIKHPEELSLQHVDVKRLQIKSAFSRKSEDRWSTLPMSKKGTVRKLKDPIRPTGFALEHVPSITHTKPRTIRTPHRRPQVYGPPAVRNQVAVKYQDDFAHQTLSRNMRPESMFLSQSLYGATHKLDYTDDPNLINSPVVSPAVAIEKGSLFHFKNFYQRARFSSIWLELGKSLMEQGIYSLPLIEDDSSEVKINGFSGGKPKLNGDDADSSTREQQLPMVRLRFKYNNFYDLSAKNDPVRINQLFEQARWTLVSEAIECTNEEASLFAALKLQLYQTMNKIEPHSSNSGELRSSTHLSGEMIVEDPFTLAPNNPLHHGISSQYLSDASISFRSRSFTNLRRHRAVSVQDLDLEIDSLLEDLTETCLEEGNLSPTLRCLDGGRRKHYYPSAAKRKPSTGITVTDSRQKSNGKKAVLTLPELSGYVRICKPRHFGIKVYKRVYAVLTNTTVNMFKSIEDYQAIQAPMDSVNILGCESYPDISPTSDKYALKIFIPVSKTVIPLSSALTANDPENLNFAGRLKRRASLLSLTSLGGLGAVCGRVVSQVAGLLTELIIRLPDEANYVEWSAAVRLAGSLSATSSPETVRRLYEAEKRATTSLLQLLSPKAKTNIDVTDKVDASLKSWLITSLSDLLPIRMISEQGEPHNQGVTLKKKEIGGVESAQPVKDEAQTRLLRYILDVRSHLPEMSPAEIKLEYITRWQQLSGNGVIYFLARFETRLPVKTALGITAAAAGEEVHYNTIGGKGDLVGTGLHGNDRQVTISVSRRDEVAGIGNGRVARHDQSTGEIHAAWRLDAIQGWHVNRELNELILLLASTPDEMLSAGNRSGGRVIIRPADVPVQKLGEVIGANVFLNLRSRTKSQELDESMFYKLIGANRNAALPAQTLTSR